MEKACRPAWQIYLMIPRQQSETTAGAIGLNNAFARMRMYYGEEVSWDVKSIQDMGTIITLKIPMQDKEWSQ